MLQQATACTALRFLGNVLHCRAFLELQVLACRSSSSQATTHMIINRMTHHDLPHSASQRKVKPLLKVVES